MEDDTLENDLRDLEKLNPGAESSQKGKAPTATIETIVIGRPWKVISMLLSLLGLLCLFIASASSDWLHTDTIRVGLWEECVLNASINVSCTTKPCTKDYAQICAYLTVASLCLITLAAFMIGTAMKLSYAMAKAILYNITIIVQLLSVTLFVIPLVGYPFSFMKEVLIHSGPVVTPKNPSWHLGWAYYMGWIGVCIAVLAACILIKDRKSEELIYRERIHYEQLDD